MSGQTDGFIGLQIACFESRMANEALRLIERAGGTAHVSPSMQEVSVSDDGQIVDFCHRLITGQIDVAIFQTGVGTRGLLEIGVRHIPRQRLIDALSDISTVLRGPKPLAVFRELGIDPTIVAAEPHTWRDVLTAIDHDLSVRNKVVAVQEYGVSNVSLAAGLEARGAIVEQVRIYRWELPDDLGPLQQNIQRIADGRAEIVIFTSAQQAVHLFQVSEQMGVGEQLREGIGNSIVASVGPSTSEALKELGVSVDFEPTRPKLGCLISQLAETAHALLNQKRAVSVNAANVEESADSSQAAWHDSAFLRACRGEQTTYTPIWLMRQAGRYMSEYRAIRDKMPFLELCKNPQLCSEIMCTAVEKLGVDAAIIFSDLLPILSPMGMELEFTPGDGPQIGNPIRESKDVQRVTELESLDSLHFVFETVAITRQDLPETMPLIGFAGAPFTLASYAIEGGSSRSFIHTKTLMYRAPAAWHELMGRLTRSIIRYLEAQISAGAQAVQLFDSWVGCLGPLEYQQFVLQYVREIVNAIKDQAPIISFATGNPALLPLMADSGAQVIGVDWRIGLAEAWKTIGQDRGIQGNLDPHVLLASYDVIRERTSFILAEAAGRPGHIFNLGHGVLQQTSVENARALVDIVHEESSR